ncbi:AMP-binding protein [Sphingomonas sp. 10B4]|uniref:AMP-binding protein n=1 Tax=Sphingomonas sp. 10B4 TaxID=3048575 RepID=UPI002AB4EC88|nr:AMP-binding protein [Sphingomonas sp. 10B4]MDY7525084.1 AMP-binding protein [Sphingomonas sp. 10B4]MEB0283393.1 AMP-binding protein [Sphingomonas sp. 10B4]
MSSVELRRSAVHRIACAAVAAEVRRIRETVLPPLVEGIWPEAMAIDEAGLGLDSLEQLGALGALAEMFDLDDSLLDEASPSTVGAWIDWIMAGQAPADSNMTVRTSGSTGEQRPCVHATSDLLDEAAWLAARFADRRRIVALVPANHLYGIVWTALVPSVLGVPIVVRTLGAPLGLVAGDLVVAVPEQWQAALRLIRRFPEDVVGVSSAGVLDGSVADALRAAGLARLVDVYGASETSAIAIREVPAARYDLLPRWRLVPHGADDWQLSDRAGVITDLPDHVERTGDRAFRLLGRRDGAVQVAGHNVWPARVIEALRSVDGVAEAAVRLNAAGRLKAFIVPRDRQDPVTLGVLLEQVAAEQLTVHERPKSFRFGAALPRNAMGKLEDWA